MKENTTAEKRRGAVTAAGNEEMDGLRRKGEISGREERKSEDDWEAAVPGAVMKGKLLPPPGKTVHEGKPSPNQH